MALNYVRSPERSEEGTGFSGIGDLDSCKPIYGCCELNSGPLEQQPRLLTAEPHLWPPD